MALTTDLVSYYKLDENGANTDVVDAHGSNDGTATGATPNVSGLINTAYDFTFTVQPGDYIDAVEPIPYTDFTINAWVYKDTTAESGAIYSTSSAVEPLVFFTINSDGKLSVWARSNTGTGLIQWVATTPVTASNWHMVTCTFDVSTGIFEVFLDGTSDGTVTYSGGTWGNAGFTEIGAAYDWLGAGSQGINGKIDEVGIWSRALSTAEISSLYNSGSGLAYPFVTDVTKVVSALTLSTTDEYPTLITTVPGGSLSLTASLIAPMPIAPLPSPNTVGTTLINKNYPNVEGLIAGTTKQTGNPNLVAIEGDRSW